MANKKSKEIEKSKEKKGQGKWMAFWRPFSDLSRDIFSDLLGPQIRKAPRDFFETFGFGSRDFLSQVHATSSLASRK